MTEAGTTLLKQIKTGLQTSESKEDILKWLAITRSVLCPQSSLNLHKQSILGYDSSVLKSVTEKDLHEQLKRILEILISKFSVEWMTTLTMEAFNVYVKPIFLETPRNDTLFVLFKTVTEPKRKDFCFLKCVSLLEEFLTSQRLGYLLQNKCNEITKSEAPQLLDVHGEMLISCLASLPAKAANILQHENSDVFLQQNYIPTLAMSILDSCQWAHSLVSQGQNVSLVVISALVGKLCLTGQADLLLDTLVPHLCLKVRSDFIWCRICERVFTGVPARSLEAAVVPLLKKISWYGLVEKFLGDSVVHMSVIKTLICTKLLLHRHYSKPRLLLNNILGYLASFHTRRHLFVEVFLCLLRVWGDQSTLRHVSTEQHFYLSQSLMICISNLNETEKQGFKDKLLQMLMPGVQAHLESSDPNTRLVGMTIAKALTETVDPSGPKLEFKLVLTNQMVADLMSYRVKFPEDPGLSQAEEIILVSDRKVNESGVVNGINSLKLEDNKSEEALLDLDSDDDLEPYDMSNDTKIGTAKAPKYIRDCMEGLICGSEESDRTEVCLQNAESLIRKNPFGLTEIAAEFTKILLHLQDGGCLENFLINRWKALVALAVVSPQQVAEYLTSQFYERNYSIRQRMDILEVLACAAQELSQPDRSESFNKNKPTNSTNMPYPSVEPSSWREVVQKRIESNTRRFKHGRSKPEPEPKLNRFAAVAGQFFYPLMVKVDQSEPCLDLLEKDTVLLFRLLHTLAVVLYSAINIPTVGQMGRTLLEFTWPIRFHSDSSVRQAVLISTSSIFLVVPASYLLSDLYADVTETKSWLEGVIERDVDTECQKLAAQTLLLLEDQLKKEFHGT